MGLFDFTIENSTLPSAEAWRFGEDYWASFELYPEWTGKFLYGFKGMAYHQKDYFSGTMVVVKTFRHRVGSAIDWTPYKECCDVARKMAAEFNKHLATISCNTKLIVLKPIDAIMDSISDVMRITGIFMRFDKKFEKDEVVLFEQFLDGDFKTFVCTNGLATGNGSEALDAFCHYTYHASEEKLVVCNLKGIEEDGEYKLSNPTIHSRDGRYGDKDKRDVGIIDFFRNHSCNAMCATFVKPEHIHVEECFENPSSRSVCFGENTLTKGKEAENANLSMEQNNHEPGPTRLPAYTSSDPFGPPSYDTCMKDSSS
ncbi:alpha-protein kinase vwkA-like [Ruditapes philippinarum]|uniref:alpha-protein kinase vwkA-like n=1 Tax=Ruditapes philippinarum TaxID=129788 RepID=UPI00295BAEC7|nr:alpha-protein kinase vwkA-like [Ruditapes philippinarum]XP_060582524.1 alpha-protein kinase vwkA-like [Ruditapes philippinarum]XP_060582525.1 alpha-protein kinase vwkA-like [Ruditapes philippinarum]